MNKLLFFGIVALVLLAGNVNADLGSASFMLGENMALTFISGENPALGTAVSYAISYYSCHQCAVTTAAFSALSKVSPELATQISNILAIKESPLNVAKQEVINTVYSQLDASAQMFFNNVQQVAPYFEEAIKKSPDTKIFFEHDKEENTLIKLQNGEIFARAPKGVSVEYIDETFVFKGSEAYTEGALKIKDFEVTGLDKDTKINFMPDKDGDSISISKGNLKIGYTEIPNVRDGVFSLDKFGEIESFKFIVSKATNYNIPYKGEKLSINAPEGSVIDVSKVKTNFEFSGAGFYKEFNENNEETFNIESKGPLVYKSEMGGCEGVMVSCIERSKKYQYIRVRSKDNNEIVIDGQKTVIRGLYIENIEDESKITFNGKEGSQAIFSKEPVKTNGDIMKLPNIKFDFKSEDKQCSLYINLEIFQKCGDNLWESAVIDTAQSFYDENNKLIGERGIGLGYGRDSDFYNLYKSGKLTRPQAFLFESLDAKNICDEYDECILMASKFKGKSLKEAEAYALLLSQGKSEKEAWSIVLEKKEQGLIGGEDIKLKSWDCISFIHDILDTAYTNVNEEVKDNPIPRVYGANGIYGIDVAKKLRKDGWKLISFSPDSYHPEDFTGLDFAKDGIDSTKNKEDYFGLGKVDGKVMDYNPKSKTTFKKTDCFNKLQNNFNLNVGYVIANKAEHTALLVRDKETNKLSIIENHYKKGPNDLKLIEKRDLDKWPWGNFAILVPPGSVSKKDLC